jgi:predicted HAD superfamily Cof-like phosphohydrolase
MTPTRPPDPEIRFRLRFHTEEYGEMLQACGLVSERVRNALKALNDAINEDVINVDMPSFADALVDQDYITEGTAATFGIDLRPIHAMVHTANMEKIPSGSTSSKATKPDGWHPPDVASELHRQGWVQVIHGARVAGYLGPATLIVGVDE